MIPYPNSTAFKTGNFYGLISEIAATVSVAHSTLLTIKIYLKVKIPKNKLSKKSKNNVKQIKPIMVPKMPKKLIKPKF
jgi:uncharacterized membrane protein YciS (DUF1049 family)